MQRTWVQFLCQVVHNSCNSSSRGPAVLFWPPWRTCVRTHTIKNKVFLFKKIQLPTVKGEVLRCCLLFLNRKIPSHWSQITLLGTLLNVCFPVCVIYLEDSLWWLYDPIIFHSHASCPSLLSQTGSLYNKKLFYYLQWCFNCTLISKDCLKIWE